ncbi:MAG: TonB-dependent receptor [Azonexus sp.]|nr:TonB-dependent receptor [Azonexus sp.]MDZ4316210.1 TonB-dependent receptor [Azonexus sp.]
MYPRLKPLAAILSLIFVTPLQAETPTFLASLDPVMVTATRQSMRTSELLSDVSVIESEELAQAAQSTLGDILGRQPGVEFYTSGSNGATGSVFMRGTSSGHTLVLIDGVRAGSATLGQMSSWSRLPVSQIERIEILRGPASSLYGSDAIGGVIQIFTRRGDGPFKPFFEGGVGSYDTSSATGGFSGGQNGWRYALNASVYETRGFNGIKNPKNTAYNEDRDGFKNKSISGNLAYSFAPGHEAGMSVFHSDGENKYDGGFSKTSAARDYRNQLAVSNVSTYLKNALTRDWTSTLRLGQSIDDAENTTDGIRNSLFRTEQNLYSWQNDIKTGFGTFLLGVERLDQRVSGTGNYAAEQRTIDSVLAGWNGNYQAHRLQANFRYDDNSQFGGKTTGSIAYGYRFNPNWRANIGYGTAFKAPSFNDLYYPLTYGSYGNPNLLPESSRSREAAIHYESGLHHVSLTWFSNDVKNLISWVETPPGSYAYTPSNIGNAQIKGATLAYDGQLSNFNLQANYNYLDPRDSDTGHQLARRAKHFGAASLGQQLGPWEWRAEIVASDSRFDSNANTRKMAGYAVTNLYGAYRFSGDWSVFARVNNLFDRDYELAADFATPGLNAFLGVRYAPK